MIRTVRFWIYILVTCVVLFFGMWFFLINKYSHKDEFLTTNRIDWILRDTVRINIDTLFSNSRIRDKDIYNTCIVSNIEGLNNIYISLWEFKELANIDLKRIRFDKMVHLDDIEFPMEETFKNILPEPIVKNRLSKKFDFDNFLDVNINERSRIVNEIYTANYVGFYGMLNRMSFSNEIGETQILFDYQDTVQPTLLLLYKARGSFFVILVNSDEPFDDRIVSIFNLK